VFADVLEPELQAGRVLIDYTRFVTSKTLSQLNPALPYATLRLGWMAGEHFRAHSCWLPCASSIRRSTGAPSAIVESARRGPIRCWRSRSA
jgi:hypothetical protein